MARVIRLHEYGGPEVLREETIACGAPAEGEVVIRQKAIGINFIDIYQRSGLYKLASLPAVLGMEGAGDVIAVGPGVTTLKIGDRVAYAGTPGGYAEERRAPADRLVILPASISYETAAAMMLQGMTVRYLLRETYPVTSSTVMLFHAAAGVFALIVFQWGRHHDRHGEFRRQGRGSPHERLYPRHKHQPGRLCFARARDHRRQRL